jgi:enolase
MEAIARSGHTGKVSLGMDVAASEFYKEGVYDLDFKNPASAPESKIPGTQLAELYKAFCRDYPLVSIEDPFD